MVRPVIISIVLLTLLDCKTRAMRPDAGIDASTSDASSHRFKSDYPLAQFNPGSGIGISGNPPTCVGGCTFTNTSTANVSSVTGAGTVSCSPTTGAVTCTGTGSGVSSVTGAGSTSCSPTTGAVTCTTSNSVSNGLTGATSFNSDGVLYGNGTGPIQSTVAGTSLLPLVSQGGTAAPTWQGLTMTGGGTGFTSCAINTVIAGSNVNSASPLRCLNPSQIFGVPGPMAFATGSCSITSSFAVCGTASITLTINSGQVAYIWAHATVHNTAISTPANGFLVDLEINGGTLIGTVTTGAAPGSGTVNETDVNVDGMMQDGIAGTNVSFAIELAHTEGSAVTGGVLQASQAQIFGLVAGP